LTRRITGASLARSFRCWTSTAFFFVAGHGDVADDLPHRPLAGGIKLLQNGVYFRRRGHDDTHLPTGEQLEGLQGVIIQRVGHGQHQLVLVLMQRQGMRLLEEADGHTLLQHRYLWVIAGVQKRYAKLFRKRQIEFAFSDQIEFYQDGAQTLTGAARLLRRQGARQLDLVQLPPGDQALADALTMDALIIRQISLLSMNCRDDSTLAAQRPPAQAWEAAAHLTEARPSPMPHA
jgi:hypothetical protein